MPDFDRAATGINLFNASLVSIGTALLSTAVIISAIIIASQVGGQGIQRPVRQVALTLGIVAFFLKGYSTLSTGTMALF